MIDFNTSQLTWIVIAACSAGGTGYLRMDSNVNDIDTKIAVTQTKLDAVDQKLADLQKQLSRIEDKLDKK